MKTEDVVGLLNLFPTGPVEERDTAYGLSLFEFSLRAFSSCPPLQETCVQGDGLQVA